MLAISLAHAVLAGAKTMKELLIGLTDHSSPEKAAR